MYFSNRQILPASADCYSFELSRFMASFENVVTVDFKNKVVLSQKVIYNSVIIDRVNKNVFNYSKP